MSNYEKLIIDVGMHKGEDTEFYLQKGFNVVAIEACPAFSKLAFEKLKKYIDEKKLTILNVGIAENEGVGTFYQCSHEDWSCFSKEKMEAAKQNFGFTYTEYEVPCITFDKIIKNYDVPYYLKIDIEGNDIFVLREILKHNYKPRYLSIESHFADYLAYLKVIGYSKFKIVNQAENYKCVLPYPAKEGVYVERVFDGLTSGPFGEETPGDWKSYEDTVLDFLNFIKGNRESSSLTDGWFDFHATGSIP
jgi:FkbM family methyltransferase